MPNIVTIFNSTQNNYLPIIVTAIPIADPEDLIWVSGGTADTITGGSGTIFSSITGDQVNPAFWYHGGNPPIPTDTIKVHGCDIVSATNATIEVISDEQQKGLYELRTTPAFDILNISTAAEAQITTTVNHNYSVGNYVEIKGVGLTIIPAGIYKIVTIISPVDFTINYDSTASLGVVGTSTVNLFNYYWDEVYTTPLGLYIAKPDSVTDPGFFEFFTTNDNSDELRIYINDPNIIPKIGDSIVIQRFFQLENSFTNESTTDGLNHVTNYSKSESYEFKILAVSGVADTPPLVQPYVNYTITLDKSFAPITVGDEKYMIVLLNRKGTTVNRELFTDTWQLTQVYRSQLLGDPYNFTGVTLPTGRKNFLYYKGAEFLGVKNLLQGVISEEESPFIILDFADEIIDRIHSATGEFEVHLPTIMLQGENTPTILTNTNPYNFVSPVLNDTAGAGTYSALYLKYPNITPAVRYGWIFYDLRIAVIDHGELATAMGYNANRNYTLPKPFLPTTANSVARSSTNSPILITNATNGNPIVITTILNHNLVTGDQVLVNGITGNIAANSSSGVYFYVNVLSPTTFQIFQDSLLTVPIDGSTSGLYAGGGLMYGNRLPFEYFFTYRLKGIHYDTMPYATLIPFNWQLAGSTSDNVSAILDTTFEPLTHLVDSNVVEGFEADQYEIIIGKYTQSLTNPYQISGIEDVVVMSASNLKTLGVQNLSHINSFLRSTYDTAVNDANTMLVSNPANPKYDILNVNAHKIYNLISSSLPSTLFTSEGEWTIGLIKYKSQARQYRLTFDAVIPADKWNGTQNPSFESGNILMNEKLITEIEFIVEDPNGTDSPYIYAKVSPPIKKNNLTDLKISLSLDF